MEKGEKDGEREREREREREIQLDKRKGRSEGGRDGWMENRARGRGGERRKRIKDPRSFSELEGTPEDTS